MIGQLVHKGSWLASLLLVGVSMAGCSPATTPVSATLTASPIPVATRPVPTAEPATAMPAASTAAASPVPPVTPAALTCEAAEQWTQTQNDLTLSLCFEPHPPRLGVLTTYQAVLIDSSGQPVSDATLELTMVGGMANMEGEHDEDFSVTLASQGAGLYTTEARVGPTDLVLTQIRIEIRRDRQLWSFTASAGELASP